MVSGGCDGIRGQIVPEGPRGSQKVGGHMAVTVVCYTDDESNWDQNSIL